MTKKMLYMLFSYRKEEREFHYILYSILLLYLIVNNMIKLSIEKTKKSSKYPSIGLISLHNQNDGDTKMSF